MLKPQIDHEIKKNVKRSAIIMALRRLSESLKEDYSATKPLMFKGSDISIKSDIFEITVKKTSDTISSAVRIYDMVDAAEGELLTMTMGLHDLTILTNEKYKEQIEKLFSKSQVKKVVTGLAAVVVKIPVEALEINGVLYALTKALSWENVNIIEVVSTLTEEIFFVREQDVPIAFAAFKDLISKNNASKKPW